MPDKEECHYCGKKLYPEKMKIHLKYFCGPWAQKTEKQARQKKKTPKFQGFGGNTKGQKRYKKYNAGISGDPEKNEDDAEVDQNSNSEKEEISGEEEEDWEDVPLKNWGKKGVKEVKGGGKKRKKGRGKIREENENLEEKKVDSGVNVEGKWEGIMRNSQGKSGANSYPVLHSVHWKRIVLDEVPLRSS